MGLIYTLRIAQTFIFRRWYFFFRQVFFDLSIVFLPTQLSEDRHKLCTSLQLCLRSEYECSFWNETHLHIKNCRLLFSNYNIFFRQVFFDLSIVFLKSHLSEKGYKLYTSFKIKQQKTSYKKQRWKNASQIQECFYTATMSFLKEQLYFNLLKLKRSFPFIWALWVKTTVLN